MHILSIHNAYQIRGGEDESCAAEQQLLREQGHEVDVYQEDNARIQTLNSAHAAIKTTWSAESYRDIRRHLAQHPVDIVHIQNFFPLISPSVHHAAKDAGVPVVQTLRNYRLLCPNALFFRAGQVCEDCLGKPIPYPGVLHGCYRESRAASAAVAAMLVAHRLLRTWIETVDYFIALTEFARQKFIEGGLPAHKIVVKPNFVSPDPGVGDGRGGYMLYVGRLSVEKGLDTLIDAWQRLDSLVPLKIIGDGPLSDQVKAAAQTHPSIEWLGRQPMNQVHNLMGSAMAVIFPSKWYETFGRVAIEAFAKGTPVIASNIGAIAELVDSGQTGLRFRPGDPDDLAYQVKWILDNPIAVKKMRHAVRVEYEAKYTAKANYWSLLDIYHKAILSASQQ
jgi:glycosyltransferase involved in cell wall biosynthesis